MTHPLQWFLDRIGKKVHVTRERGGNTEEFILTIASDQYEFLYGYCQERGDTFRDPHPLSASILNGPFISCDYCGKVSATEQLDHEQAAREFEGDGWKRLDNGTINCGCKKGK